MLSELVKTHEIIVTIEEGVAIGGFGSAILEYISNNNIDIQVESIAIPDIYIEHASRKEQLDEIGLTGPKILDSLISIDNKNNEKSSKKIVSLVNNVD